MSDIFKEQLVVRKPNSKDLTKKVGAIILAIIIVFVVSIFIPAISIFILVACIVGVVYIFSLTKVEYEYIFTNGELDIDAIFNKSKRKRQITFMVKDAELITKINNQEHMNSLANGAIVKDFSTGVLSENSYAIILNKDAKKYKIIIEPNEEILKEILRRR